MLIFDGDYPMAALAMDLRRDVTLPIDELRKHDHDYENIAMASLPEMRRTGMAVAILKVVSDMQREGATITGTNQPHRTYAIGKGQVGFYDALEDQGDLRIIRTRGDLTDHMAEWEAAPGTAGREKLRVGAILGLEGADLVVEPAQLGEWWDDGIRLVSLGHYGVSPYAHHDQSDGAGSDAREHKAADILGNRERRGEEVQEIARPDVLKECHRHALHHASKKVPEQHRAQQRRHEVEAG